MTRVLPLPAPARINTGPSTVSTALRCSGFSLSRRSCKGNRRELRAVLDYKVYAVAAPPRHFGHPLILVRFAAVVLGHITGQPGGRLALHLAFRTLGNLAQ